MKERVKQRIVGAFVLVALAVIFLPLLFSLEAPRLIDKKTAIPAAPKIAPVAISEPVRDHIMEPPKSIDTAFMPPAPVSGQLLSTVITAKAPGPGLGDDQILDAWVIQVGNFGERKRADDIVKQLQEAGYKAYVHSTQSADRRVNRVYVGPLVLKPRAFEQKAKIDRLIGVKSLVLAFEP